MGILQRAFKYFVVKPALKQARKEYYHEMLGQKKRFAKEDKNSWWYQDPRKRRFG